MKNRKLLVVGLCGALCLSLAGFTYASAQAADARTEPHRAKPGKAALPAGQKPFGQQAKQREQDDQRRNHRGEAHCAVLGEKAHDFPAGSETCADHAAQQRQRTAEDVHKSPPFD